MLIDTGANQSFISPNAYKKFYSNIPLKYDPFFVTNSHVTTKNDYSLIVPCFAELGNSRPIKLYVYKFHDFFDGLIGYEQLEKWGAKLNFVTRTLETKLSNIPVQMYRSQCRKNFHYIIPAQTKKIIQIPVNIEKGDVFIEEQYISGCFINECVSCVKNNKTLVQITNPTENDIALSIQKPIQTYAFNEQTLQHEIDTNAADARTRDVLSRLRTEHLNPEEKINLTRLCTEYSDVFYLEGETLSFTNDIKHHIRTTDDTPIYCKTYRYPYVHKEEVQNQIKSMLDQNIIRPSSSPYNAPVWVVPKKSDASGKVKWRLVIDFRRLNEKTIDDKYPIPNINDILDKLGRCLYFTTLDLKSGFFQVELNFKDSPKTAFSVEQGHFEFLRMPMGLKNSPEMK